MAASNSTIIRIGIEDDEHEFFECMKHFDVLKNCQSISYQALYYWLKIISNDKLDILVYPTNISDHKNETLFQDLQDGYLDMYPREYVLEPNDEVKYSIIPLDMVRYKFYTKIMPIEENGFLFLLSPLDWRKWLIFIIVTLTLELLIFLVGKIKSIQTLPHYSTIVDHLIFWQSVFICFILCLYSSNLKSVVQTSTKQQGFKSLYELAEKIEQHGVTLYLESHYSFRVNLLTDERVEKPKEFVALEKALKKVGNGLKFVDNLTQICDLVSKNENAVYFGTDRSVNTNCPEFCFFEYTVKEIPAQMIVLLASTEFVANKTEHNLYSKAIIDGYRYNTLRIKRNWKNCKDLNRITFDNEFIKMKSLIVTFSAYFVVLTISVMIFILETFVFHRKRSII